MCYNILLSQKNTTVFMYVIRVQHSLVIKTYINVMWYWGEKNLKDSLIFRTETRLKKKLFFYERRFFLNCFHKRFSLSAWTKQLLSHTRLRYQGALSFQTVVLRKVRSRYGFISSVILYWCSKALVKIRMKNEDT